MIPLSPEDAEEIYHQAMTREFLIHQAEFSPANQRKAILAGFQAVIDAVVTQIDADWAKRILLMNQVENTTTQ